MAHCLFEVFGFGIETSIAAQHDLYLLPFMYVKWCIAPYVNLCILQIKIIYTIISIIYRV